MTTLETNIPAPLDFGGAFECKVYESDLRLEVGIEDGTERIAIHEVMKELIRRMEEVAEFPLEVMDTKGKKVQSSSLPEGEEFQKCFGVELVEGKSPKIVLGFRMRTKTKLSVLKQRMYDHLRDNKLYLRVHSGGYQHGVNYMSLGYLREENPTTADVKAWTEVLLREMNAVWKNSVLVPEHVRKQVIDNFPLQATKNKVSFPIMIEKGKLMSVQPNKKKIETVGLVVMTPSKFVVPVRKLLEGVLVSNKSFKSFVPNALRREDSDVYYKVMLSHAKFIHNHRNIQIHGIAPERFNKDIRPMLERNKAILRIYVDKEKSKANISTTAADYLSVGEWIDGQLSQLSLEYRPYRVIRPGGASVQTGHSGTTKFSQLFQDEQSSLSDGSSFDPSTIKTTKSNAWTRRLPVKIAYSSAEEFPPLPSKSTGKPSQVTTPASSENTDNISAMIAAAVQKIELEQAKRIEEITQNMNERVAQLEQSLSTIVTKVVEATYQSMLTSGMFTNKDEHIQLKAQVHIMDKKLDSILAAMTDSINSKVHSPPRKNPRMEEDNDMSSALLIHDAAMSEREH